ncbi:hypothetical protein [Streptomyces sp. AC602_WCS936]|uniref:hypothetical protein n=1 Tax=Streptomyces sp. AC602_WCS936 TaxID=2823685 RepID=UPI0027E52B1E|nr:hypothetical protein [Streptomyces sp. AC602_WCS936]
METGASAPLRLLTVDDVRAALLAGHGFPGDQEAFEVDLQRALEATPGTDLTSVAAVILDYRGRIRLRQDPDFDVAVQEGIDLTMHLKRDARGEATHEGPTRRSSCK